jgi:N-acetylmuramate 1-kinase
MHTRQNALSEWIQQQFNHQAFTLTPLAGDASFRRYFRVVLGEITRVIMDAPPSHETIQPFINVNQCLQQGGITTPTIHAVDVHQGFALLDDLGDKLFLHAITPSNQNQLYHSALDTLIQLQRCSTTSTPLPHFDAAHRLKEMSLYHEWFLNAYLQLTLTAAEVDMLHASYHWLSEQLQTQPQVFIHRDFHSRNLMILDHANEPHLSVIDFQDAMCGPITYDLVSLLKDCYIQLTAEAYHDYASYFYQHQPLVQTWSMDTFLDQVDYCGLQRHLKVLGIFCRLHLRDNKPAYLGDLPLTLDYTLRCLERHPQLDPLLRFTQQRVLPRFQAVYPS